jgi:SOS-response transcriptional repressor LexA
MEPAGLTGNCVKALAFVQEFIDTNGLSPSIQEIAHGIGWKSKGHAHAVVDMLVERGYLTRLPGRNRSLAVLRHVPGYAAADGAIPPSLNMDRYQQIEEAILRNCVVVLGEDPTPHEEGALRRLAMAMVPLVDDRVLADRLMRIGGALANTASEIRKRSAA